MKKGFTLQEALITIAIIGIVSAAILPSVQKLFPDENKLKYIKSYNTLAKSLTDIFSDYYWTTEDPATGGADCLGLTCMNYPGNNISGFPVQATWNGYITNKKNGELSTKFPRLLASKMNLQSNINCTVNDSTNSSVCYFQTIDGVTWEIDTTYKNESGESDQFNTTIKLDVVPNAATLAGEFASSKTIAEVADPEHFSFSLDRNGSIRATDALGLAYLKDSTNMHNTKALKARLKGTSCPVYSSASSYSYYSADSSYNSSYSSGYGSD